VRVRNEAADGIMGELENFRVRLSGGEELVSRTVILATGVRDVLPDIPGIDRYWGKGVFQCPFCDGWEHRDQPVAVLASQEQATEAVSLYRNWSRDLTLLTNGAWEPDSELAAMGVNVNTDPIERVEGDGTHANRVVFSTGRELPVAVFWLRPEQLVRNELAVELGCELYDAGPITGLVKLEGPGQTTVPGVFAAGDITTPMHQVSLAVASGTMAAAGATRLLIAADNNLR
jgi:thioredoxin reductase